jgi:hypothetical protein
MKTFGFLFIFSMSMMCCAGCGKNGPASSARDLIGTWESAGPQRPWTIEFMPDNQIRMRTIGSWQSGKFRLDPASSVWIDLNDGRRLTAQVAFSHGDLELADGGTSTKFIRTR